MLKWIAAVVLSMGIYGVALLMAVENVILPLPSELIMPLAGFAASRGMLSLAGVIIAGTTGSVLGALPLYYLARVAGEQRVKHWVTTHRRWLLIRSADIDRSKRWFERHGNLAVSIGQLVPGVRGMISLPAGYVKMNVFAFLLYKFIGTAVWCGLLAYAGYTLGTRFNDVHEYVGPAGDAVLAGVLLWGGIVVWKRRKGKKLGTAG
jgi:membrane protein DedA with SNARE-associated domain